MTATTTAIAEYKPIEAVLAALTERHKGVVFDVSQASGLAAAKAAAKDIAQYRIALEKARVDLKADVLARGRLIDGEAKRIQAQLSALEDPIVDQIKAEERRIEAERQAAIEAEQRRLAEEEAARKRAEEERIAAERRKLEEERAKFEAEQRAARERAEAEERERRAKLEAEERAARERIAEEERKAREGRAAEEARLRAEREKIDAERRAKEEAERKEREAREAAAREEQRQAAERQSARDILTTFVQRFDGVLALRPIVAAVKQLIPQLDAIIAGQKKAA